MTPIFRPTTEQKIVSGLRHAIVFAFAIALFAAGSVILVANVKALTIPILIAIGVLYVLAMGLAIFTEFKQVIVFVVQYLPDRLVGGQRKDDPKLPPTGGAT